jgi:superfamily II DNA or RNA helicase
VFLDEAFLRSCGWQAFERAVQRLLVHLGYGGVRLVGQSGDEGADVIGHAHGKRWLFQVKYWRQKVGRTTVNETLRAASVYRAQVPVVVSLSGFDEGARVRQGELQRSGVPLQLWDSGTLRERLSTLPDTTVWSGDFRPYQNTAIEAVVTTAVNRESKRALVVMATGLGKTVVAAEAIRRIRASQPWRVLVLAHTNSLVYQLERAFWPFLLPRTATAVWNGYERPARTELETVPFIFASVQSVYEAISRREEIPYFDAVIVDECHHAASDSYRAVLQALGASGLGPTFLVGLTATPWRRDQRDLTEAFGEPVAKTDIVEGMRMGYLANVDYQMFTDNIRWAGLGELTRGKLSPRAINRTLFITEWDDAVVEQLFETWKEQHSPRAIVFCGTIDHAITMRDRINAMGFARAGAVYSTLGSGRAQSAPERARLLADFHDGVLGVLCTVDMLNEGVDIPDVNVIVFQRVTHSRRIFVQQLGRGLRLAPNKDRVIVLDFVSDIRRFAAGLELKEQLAKPGIRRMSINHKVSFRRLGGEDGKAESFLREWLEDVTAVSESGEDASVLKFPPPVEGGRNDT